MLPTIRFSLADQNAASSSHPKLKDVWPRSRDNQQCTKATGSYDSGRKSLVSILIVEHCHKGMGLWWYKTSVGDVRFVLESVSVPILRNLKIIKTLLLTRKNPEMMYDLWLFSHHVYKRLWSSLSNERAAMNSNRATSFIHENGAFFKYLSARNLATLPTGFTLELVNTEDSGMVMQSTIE